MRRFLSPTAPLALVILLAATSSASAQKPGISFKQGASICYIGNTLADRMQHHAWLETYLSATYPKRDLVFRNLGFAGDEVKTRPRSQNFGSADQWLTKCKADVVFCFFGYNEALRGAAYLPTFEKDLAAMIDGMMNQKYNGSSPPQIVIFSPIAHEDLKSPHLPDGKANNINLAVFSNAMGRVAKAKGVSFVNLFAITKKLYATAKKPLTMNGIHLLSEGNRAVAREVMTQFFAAKLPATDAKLAKLREAILDKNMHWFSRYRVVDGYNVYGGRSRLAWFGQSNADVMKREMEIFDIKTANRDKRIWAVAQGGDLKIKDDNLPALLKVKTNKQGPLKDGAFPYLSAKKSMEKMTLAKGVKVNVFASEEMFPELVNPVQMAVDPNGRLFASVWPSYPHWNPTQKRTDRIVCLPDDNKDGVADKCVIFADKLNSITGFEFWGGGMLVAAPPEVWFLKDTDGDYKADVKIRVLQGLSSADTHHTANAMVIGTDGWLYWSRGVFHVTNMETPTKTFRSKASGVYRFNPRTFEVEFHYPIGPNPHGDVIDQWGYQFVNDGTSGTGCYANIGKGIRNKQWFKKEWRPVAATGLLSSSHFPDKNQGNFLICNTIGFLGVLQYEIKYNGADITAVRTEDLVRSADPNFRPTDIEVGGDGAVYVSDWCNALIGHMQHNMRDPNRDHSHGRIYRFTHTDRPLVHAPKLIGKPIAEVCKAFYAKENGTRYRARLELSGRDSKQIAQQVAAWAAKLDVSKPADAQALLECLWVFEEHRIPNEKLLNRVFQAAEPRVRAAAIRTLGHWGAKVKGWEKTLIAAARDKSALVRAEAVKAAVAFEGLPAAEVIFEAGIRQTDPELDFVLRYAKSKLNVDRIVNDARNSGRKLSTAAETYVLRNASVADLLKLKKTEAVYLAILSRPNVPPQHLRSSLDGLSSLRNADKVKLLLDMIDERDAGTGQGLSGLGSLLTEQPAAKLKSAKSRLAQFAASGKSAVTRQLGYAAWIAADGSPDNAFIAASQSKDKLRDFLACIPTISDTKLRAGLYAKVQPLMRELPAGLQPEAGRGGSYQPGIQVEYYYPTPKNVAIETLKRRKPKASGVVPRIVLNVPQRKEQDRFALKFTGLIRVDQRGEYTFFTTSDDGSRLYIDGKQIVNNDGKHGPRERSGNVVLTAGFHQIIVTYYDNGGGDALAVHWAGPNFKKQAIPAERLSVRGGETLHDVAIRALADIPGNEQQKFLELTALIKAGRNHGSAVDVIRTIPIRFWAEKEVQPLVDNLVSYLSEMPASYRTSKPAMNTIALAKSAAKLLSAEKAKAVNNRLANLDVRVIAIGTVPHRMLYDKEVIVVAAGKPVEFRFSNSDSMPHNLAITLPGAMKEIGELAEKTARDAGAKDRHYIPESNKILLSSKLLQPGESQALSFNVPKTPGVYPIVCTYPGHWRRMYGALYVVENPAKFEENREAYLKANRISIKDDLLKLIGKSREWKIAELSQFVKPLEHGRSYEVGKNAFKVANCMACHKFGSEGNQFGPDLTKLEAKKLTGSHILESLLTPSAKIDDKYRTNAFRLDSGQTVNGMILKETADAVEVIENPIAKAKPLVLKKSEILRRKKLEKSIMPEGLLNRLTREEILDLIAYLVAKGKKDHMLFKKHDH